MKLYKNIEQIEDDLKLLLVDVTTWDFDEAGGTKESIIAYINRICSEERDIRKNKEAFLDEIKEKTKKATEKKEKLEDLDNNDLKKLLRIIGTDNPVRILRKLRDIIERTGRIENMEGLEKALLRKWNKIEGKITYKEHLHLGRAPVVVRSTLIEQNRLKNNDILRARIVGILVDMHLYTISKRKESTKWEIPQKIGQVMRNVTKRQVLIVTKKISQFRTLLDTRMPYQKKTDTAIRKYILKLRKLASEAPIGVPPVQPTVFDASNLSEENALQELDKRRLEAYELIDKTDKSTADYKKLHKIYQELEKIWPKLAKGQPKRDVERILEDCLEQLQEYEFSRTRKDIESHYKKAYKKAAEYYNDDRSKQADACLKELKRIKEKYLKDHSILKLSPLFENKLEPLLQKGEEYDAWFQALEDWTKRSKERKIELAGARIKAEEVIKEINSGYEAVAKLYDDNKPGEAKENYAKTFRIGIKFLEQNKEEYREILRVEIVENIKETSEKFEKAKTAYNTRKENDLEKCVELMKRNYEKEIELLEKNKPEKSDERIQEILSLLNKLQKDYPDDGDALKATILRETEEERDKCLEAQEKYFEKEDQKQEEERERENAEKRAEKVIKDINSDYDAVAKLYDENKPVEAARKKKETAKILFNFLKNNKEKGESLNLLILNGIKKKNEGYKQAENAYLEREKSESQIRIDLIKKIYEDQTKLLENDEENANEKISKKIGPVIKKLVNEFSGNKGQLYNKISQETKATKEKYEEELEKYIERKKLPEGSRIPKEQLKKILIPKEE